MQRWLYSPPSPFDIKPPFHNVSFSNISVVLFAYLFLMAVSLTALCIELTYYRYLLGKSTSDMTYNFNRKCKESIQIQWCN